MKYEEIKDFVYLRHKSQANESYYLTIVDDGGLRSVNISKFNETQITFGKGLENDIVINSEFIEANQGYLEINEHGVKIINISKKVPLLGNNNKEVESLYLSERSFVKIIDKETQNGIIMIMSINENLDEWKAQPLNNGTIKLGSGGSSDIILAPTGVAKHQVTIQRTKGKTYITDELAINDVHVNGVKIPSLQKVQLNNLDIVYINNTKLIVSGNQIFYQIFKGGVRLEAYDICKDVKIKFKTKQISSHINMRVEPSEFVAFVGGSGAGKSTFLKCISGVDKPTSGTVLVNGEDLYENYESIKYNIGYVPQDDIVFSNLTLHDMLQYAAKLRMQDNASRQERNQRIEEVLDIVSLSEFENSYIRQLSGGQRKRASIAVELIADPNLFFLDEPTSGLDPGTERSMMETLKKMAQMGKTIILVTHNTLNLHLCDKVAFFGESGHLCFFGTPKEALEFFEVDDFVDIYNILNESYGEWHEKYEEINNIDVNKVKEIPKNSDPRMNIKPKKRSFIKQLIILIMRYLKLIKNDYMQLLLLLLQAPMVGIILTFVTTAELYESYDDTKAILFSMGCSCIWLGLLNAVQEICKEKVILQKENMADLKLSSYILSKFIVQGMFAFIQALMIVGIFQKIDGASPYNIFINSFWDIQLVCFLSILSAATLGLFVSSVVKNSNIAMSIIPILLVPQLVFSGMLFELEGLSEKFSNVVLCKWTVEGLGTSANLNELTHIVQTINPLIEIETEDYFKFTQQHYVNVILIIILMTLVLLVGCYLALRKTVKNNM